MDTLVERLQSRTGFMTVSELAEFINSHPQTIYKLKRVGKLPYLQVGGRIKFDPVAIAEWLKARSIG